MSSTLRLRQESLAEHLQHSEYEAPAAELERHVPKIGFDRLDENYDCWSALSRLAHCDLSLLDHQSLMEMVGLTHIKG